jgi:hypothetical protein
MRDLRAGIAAAGREWRPVAQQTFRRVVLGRAERYLASGHDGTTADDEDVPVSLGAEFFTTTNGGSHLDAQIPHFKEFLREYPRVSYPVSESFLYWSKERLGAKPVVSITHVSIAPGRPPRGAVVAAKQVFATHYLTASLSLTTIVNGTGGDPTYLMYENRSRADVFSGPFGGLVRSMVERRLRAEAPQVLDDLRRKLEGGEPPVEAGTPWSGRADSRD